MIGKEWKIGRHHFWSDSEYQAALRDQKLINSLEATYNLHDLKDVDKLYNEIAQGHIRFESVLGMEFDDRIYEARTRLQEEETSKAQKKTKTTAKVIPIQRTGQKPVKVVTKEKKTSRIDELDPNMQKAVLKELKRRARRRKLLLLACIIIGVGCTGYLVKYSHAAKNSAEQYESLSALKNQRESIGEFLGNVQVHKTKEKDVIAPNILTEYKALHDKNEDMIGWIKIDDTNIDYPVMQNEDNEFYLKHNFDKNDDKNGCIFMDMQCDAISKSTNYILYGHHMQSGNMFGNLYKYENEEYGKAHSTIQFDTIYEKGTYEVMYVFRSRVYSEEDISFKYYQFIDANSSKEFNSYMNEMARESYYDTGVTAQYGDHLLTLSTCDYEETGGRFVVVCKKVK